MNKIKERRNQGAVCKVCNSPDYTEYGTCQELGVTKLTFRCNQCGNTWQYGKDGGLYALLATKIKDYRELMVKH